MKNPITLKHILALPRIELLGQMGDETLRNVNIRIHELEDEQEVVVLIQSIGGLSYVARSIFEQLRYLASVKTVHGLVMGVCHSSATYVLLALNKENRYCTKNSQFFIHESIQKSEIPLAGSYSVRESLLKHELAELSLEKESLDWSNKLYSEQTNLSLDEVIRIRNEAHPFDAEVARERGFVSTVIF